jgi:hypothetical protein
MLRLCNPQHRRFHANTAFMVKNKLSTKHVHGQEQTSATSSNVVDPDASVQSHSSIWTVCRSAHCPQTSTSPGGRAP